MNELQESESEKIIEEKKLDNYKFIQMKTSIFSRIQSNL